MRITDCEDGTVILWVPEQSDAVRRRDGGLWLSHAAFAWIHENLEGRVGLVRLDEHLAVQFYDPNDAFAFRLRWT